MAKLRSRWWLRYIVLTLILSAATVLIAWERGAFDTTSKVTRLIALSDAFFVPGFFALLFGIYSVWKTFVMKFSLIGMIVGIYNWVTRLAKEDAIDRKYRISKYTKVMHEGKYTFWYFLIIGAVFVAIGFAMMYVLYSK